MIGVLVGKEDGVGDADLFPQELLPQIGGRIDQQISLRQAEEHTAPRPRIPRVDASANLAPAADGRDADGGSSAEEDRLAADVRGLKFERHFSDFNAGGRERGGEGENLRLPNSLSLHLPIFF